MIVSRLRGSTPVAADYARTPQPIAGSPAARHLRADGARRTSNKRSVSQRRGATSGADPCTLRRAANDQALTICAKSATSEEADDYATQPRLCVIMQQLSGGRSMQWHQRVPPVVDRTSRAAQPREVWENTQSPPRGRHRETQAAASGRAQAS
jgi:hypothetical protein